MADCITPTAYNNFAAKDVNRIVGQVAKVLARKAVYMNVLEGGSLPNVSDVVRSVVQEQAVMASSLAAPQFVNDITLCGTSNPADQVGSTEYQYQLQSLRGRGPRVCVKVARTAFEGAYLQGQIALEKGVVKVTNADIRYNLLMRSGVKFVARSGVAFDRLVTGEAQAIDTKFAQYVPNAPMNFKTLYRLGVMLREELLADPFSTPDGDFFKVICSPDQIENFRNDADVKEDLRYLTAGSFKLGEESIAGYMFQGYREFAFGVDSQPLRATGFDSNGNLVLVEPEVAVPATNGVAARRNPAWINAPLEVGFIIAGDSFKRLTPERFTGEGTFKFAPQLFMGELEWVSQRDNDCNLYLDFGQHIWQISRAYQPIRPQNVIPFVYQRCPFSTALTSCPASSSNGI